MNLQHGKKYMHHKTVSRLHLFLCFTEYLSHSSPRFRLRARRSLGWKVILIKVNAIYTSRYVLIISSPASLVSALLSSFYTTAPFCRASMAQSFVSSFFLDAASKLCAMWSNITEKDHSTHRLLFLIADHTSFSISFITYILLLA